MGEPGTRKEGEAGGGGGGGGGGDLAPSPTSPCPQSRRHRSHTHTPFTRTIISHPGHTRRVIDAIFSWSPHFLVSS